MSWIVEKERFPLRGGDCYLYSDSIEYEEMVKDGNGDIYYHCEQMEGDIYTYETEIIPKLKKEIEELKSKLSR